MLGDPDFSRIATTRGLMVCFVQRYTLRRFPGQSRVCRRQSGQQYGDFRCGVYA